MSSGTLLEIRLQAGKSDKAGNWPEVNQKIQLDDSHFKEDYDSFLNALLPKIPGLPNWIEDARRDGVLFLFSEIPTRDSHPCNTRKDWPKDWKSKGVVQGQSWSNGSDMETLLQHLQNTSATKPPLFLAKVCRYCAGPGGKKLFVLTTLFDRGYCDKKPCETAAKGTIVLPAPPFQ